MIIMKKIRFIVTILLLIGSANILSAQQMPMKVKDGYKIDIQTSAICEMCQLTLEKDLIFEKGVKKAELNLDNKVMTVIYNPKKTNAEKLRKRITKIGYHADTYARDSDAYEKLPKCCKDGSHGTPNPQVPLKEKENKGNL